MFCFEPRTYPRLHCVPARRGLTARGACALCFSGWGRRVLMRLSAPGYHRRQQADHGAGQGGAAPLAGRAERPPAVAHLPGQRAGDAGRHRLLLHTPRRLPARHGRRVPQTVRQRRPLVQHHRQPAPGV